MTLRSIAILPARLGSTRLPRKVLLAETGYPLFVHTARAAASCPAVEKVLIATDAQEVIAAAKAHGFDAVLTSTEHQSGTDRVREALSSVPGDWDVVLNVQADEPDLVPGDLERLIAAFEDEACEAATLSLPIEDETDWARPSVVKIVLDARGKALYFSRAPIPSRLHARSGLEAPWGLRHIGVYAYRPQALQRFCDLPEGRLEALENLEQLRWLEHGGSMHVLPATRAPRGIDTPEDYAEFVARQTGGPGNGS